MAKAKTVKAKKAKPGVFDMLEPLPADAWGLSRVTPGFASSEQAATLLGLGYPHVILPSTEDFTGTDQELFKRQDSRVIPRNALERLYRAHSGRVGPLSVTAEVEHVLERGGPYSLWIIEAMFGTEPTARATVDRLLAYPIDAWTSGGNGLETHGWSVIRMFGFTLWRVPAALRASLRDQLERQFQRVTGGPSEQHETREGWWRSVQALDLILHGRRGAERCGRGWNDKLFLAELLHSDDDPAWVLERVLDKLTTLRPVDREAWDIQLAVIGGPKVLEALRDNTQCFKADQKKSIERQLSLVA